MSLSTDVDSKRLEFAKQCGATHTLLIQPDEEPQVVAKKVAELLGGAPERTIECSGAQFSVSLGVYVSTQVTAVLVSIQIFNVHIN